MKGFKEHMILSELAVDLNAGLAFLDKHLDTGRLNLDPEKILAGTPVKGYVEFVSERENPIMVMLSDGARLYFSLDAFKKVSGAKPERGRWMEALIQNFTKDGKSLPKVQWAVCY